MAKAAMHLVIQGLVHGVLFRASMSEEARGLGLTGWVRNNADGSVEAFIEGEGENVKRLLEWAKRGPPRARVDSVRAEKAQVRNTKEFVIDG